MNSPKNRSKGPSDISARIRRLACALALTVLACNHDAELRSLLKELDAGADDANETVEPTAGNAGGATAGRAGMGTAGKTAEIAGGTSAANAGTCTPGSERAPAESDEPDTMPAWATGFGRDEYGVYADFTLNGVVQHMRWISAGVFCMGSPFPTEVNRSPDEAQHEVVLSGGFWLADTECTQALWRAVMGDNPSSFKGDDLPVEKVSWNDVQDFLKKTEELSPGLGLSLPTEAQWEYACRAGTRTPFWFGETITTDQVNYFGEYPYGDAAPSMSPGTTVPVTALPRNGWGLYQMHGNVFEWCSDWYGNYEVLSVTDPSGPDMGTSRVLRGGAWNGGATGARSARRAQQEPSYRHDSVGLRLSRGQTGERAK